MENTIRPDQPVHVQFLNRANETPDAIAVIFESDRVTYLELANQAHRVSQALVDLGIGPGALVGVCMQRSPEMLATVVGVLLLGAAYLPLDPSDPAARLQTVLQDALPAAVLTTATLVKPISELSHNNTCVATLTANRDVPQKWDYAYPVGTPDDTIYVIYTSGSTGAPKGVVMTHGAVTRLIRWQIESSANHLMTSGLDQSTELGVLQYTPLTFDVSFLEIFSALCSGRTLVMCRESHLCDLPKLQNLIIEHRIGSIFLPLTMLDSFAEFATQRGHYPTELFEVITGGEQLRITKSIRDWFSLMPRCTLQNIYGPTETHVAAAQSLLGSAQNWPYLPPIGKPIDGTTIYLLNAELKPVAAGEIGEICIGGASLSKGYLGRPDLTSERFLTSTSERIYRTGDLGHQMPDGSLAYDGRLDDQVKIQGVRIEPGEIEHTLEQHPHVRRCVVSPFDTASGKRLAAYLVVESGCCRPTLIEDVQAYLAKRLPTAYLPSRCEIVDSLPINSNGKVDKQRLRSPSRCNTAIGAPSTRTRMQRLVVELWRQHLEVDSVGLDDPFFQLGGRSLLLVRIQLALSEALGREVPMILLLKNPTARRLAADLEKYESQAK